MTEAVEDPTSGVLGLAAVALGPIGVDAALVPSLRLAALVLGVVAVGLGGIAWRQGRRRSLAVAGAVAGAGS